MTDFLETIETDDDKKAREAAQNEQSVREFIYQTLDKAEAKPRIDGKAGNIPGNTELLFNKDFLEALRQLREINPNEYLQIDARWRAHKLIPFDTIRKLDKLTAPTTNKGQPLGSKADNLTALVRELSELFHDDDDQFYASVDVPNGNGDGTHRETFLLKGRDFRRWAAKIFFQHYETAPGDSAFKDALETLEGFAADGVNQKVYTRYAQTEAGIFVFLGDVDCNIVEITKDGWQVKKSQDVAVRFRRTVNTKPLPIPQKGDFSQFWTHVNEPDEDTKKLVEAWLLECMRTETPYPVLEVSGEQGSAKSTFQERLCFLVDPAKVNLRRRPKAVEDLFVAAKHTHLLCYDNMSGLTHSEQDALCIMSTGGGFGTRQLHTTSEEEMWEAQRPVIIGGISELATNADLGDRIVAVELPKVKAYLFEDELERKWKEAYPAILGGLYDRMVLVLRYLDSIKIDKPPRMADFAKLGQALFIGVGVKDKTFTETFLTNRDRVVTRAIEASPIALAVLKLIEEMDSYKGKTADLLTMLSNKYKPTFYDPSAWAKSPRQLGAMLRRIAPSLRLRGIEISHKRTADGWLVELVKIAGEKKPTEVTI